MSVAPGGRHLCPRACLSASKDFYLFDTTDGPHLLVVDGSQIFKIGDDLGRAVAAASAQGEERGSRIACRARPRPQALHRR